jgi:hypothetical protein
MASTIIQQLGSQIVLLSMVEARSVRLSFLDDNVGRYMILTRSKGQHLAVQTYQGPCQIQFRQVRLDNLNTGIAPRIWWLQDERAKSYLSTLEHVYMHTPLHTGIQAHKSSSSTSCS